MMKTLKGKPLMKVKNLLSKMTSKVKKISVEMEKMRMVSQRKEMRAKKIRFSRLLKNLSLKSTSIYPSLKMTTR